LFQKDEVIMLAYLFVVIAVAFRFLPQTLGFTPVTASLLFFGARGSKRQMWIPVALLAASDILLTTLRYRYPVGWDHLVSIVWYAAILLLGTTLRKNAGPVRVILTAVASSVSFFLISNFGAWVAWRMYPMTLEGLETCYVAALPFFRRGLEGDILFTCVMFGIPALAQYWSGAAGKSTHDHTAA
jgi:small basic protein